jgi:hypothetical protein
VSRAVERLSVVNGRAPGELALIDHAVDHPVFERQHERKGAVIDVPDMFEVSWR